MLLVSDTPYDYHNASGTTLKIEHALSQTTMDQLTEHTDHVPDLTYKDKVVLGTAMVIVVIGFVVLIFIRASIETRSSFALQEISILKHGYAIYPPMFVFFASYSVLIVSGRYLRRHTKNRIVWFLVGSTFVLLVCSCPTMNDPNDSWVNERTVQGPDGHQYVLLRRFTKGPTQLALGRVAEEGLLYHHYDILGVNHIDYEEDYGFHQESYAEMVRPKKLLSTRNSILYITDEGMLLGLYAINACHLAYDISSKQFYGRHTIHRLSPFLLVKDDSRLLDRDVESLVRYADPSSAAFPSQQILQEATQHANLEVRQIAEKLLEISKKGK